MKSPFITLLLFVLITGNLFAVTPDPVLMTINKKPVLKSEFEYIYNKNNSNNSLDKKTLDEYVDLFVNFKLKVEEAETQGIDTTSAFINELSGYRSQLTKPYLTDQKVDEQLLQEAYNRMKEDVDVSHILIRIPENASPADTLKAWNEINAISKRLQKEDFAKVAKDVSQDQSVEQNEGHIGWISAFRTVYPFETMAYNTPVGTISKPVRSAFGYHIVKVLNRRNSLGEVLVSHIMMFTSKDDPAMNATAKTRIDSIYNRIIAGDDFGTLAAKYSMDKGSSVKNGELPWFGSGRMVLDFENAAFDLKKAGDISKPIQSPYGWHIVKLLDKKGIEPFDNIKDDIERKVKRDERAGFGKKTFVEKLKNDYKLEISKQGLQDFYNLANKIEMNDSLYLAKSSTLSGPLFSFADKKFSQKDFYEYIKTNNFDGKSFSAEKIKEKFDAFVDSKLLAYEDSQLENKYDEFRFLMQEYHDGILLFEVSNQEVWDKASKDTEGLEKYFKAHKTDYTWDKPHYKGHVVFCKDKETLKAAKKIVSKSQNDSIDKYLRTRLNDSIQYVKVEKGLYVQGDNKAVDKYAFKTKAAYTPDTDYPYVFVTGKMLKKIPENYSDVRGLVTADYQEFLEKEWIKALRKKYPVVINNEILNTVKKN